MCETSTSLFREIRDTIKPFPAYLSTHPRTAFRFMHCNVHIIAFGNNRDVISVPRTSSKLTLLCFASSCCPFG